MGIKEMIVLVLISLAIIVIVIMAIIDKLEERGRRKANEEFREKNKGKYVIMHSDNNGVLKYYVQNINSNCRTSSADVSHAMIFDSYFFAEKLISNYIYNFKYENYRVVKL